MLARGVPTARLLARPVPWRSAAFLFGYAAAFSLAYLRIGAATGALVLFGTVQTVMYTAAIRRGEQPGRSGWVGLVLAVAGLVALVTPGVSAPDLAGVALMVVAGAAWAGYTLAGRSGGDPLVTSARNFVWSLPLALVLEVGVVTLRPGTAYAQPHGIALAVACRRRRLGTRLRAVVLGACPAHPRAVRDHPDGTAADRGAGGTRPARRAAHAPRGSRIRVDPRRCGHRRPRPSKPDLTCFVTHDECAVGFLCGSPRHIQRDRRG